jgi:ubiquinone/menaquinone biosynthesis C-methylase UbiE
MLAVAKAKVPGADFCQSDLRALPVANQEVDLVTISLALTHVPELAPVPEPRECCGQAGTW